MGTIINAEERSKMEESLTADLESRLLSAPGEHAPIRKATEKSVFKALNTALDSIEKSASKIQDASVSMLRFCAANESPKKNLPVHPELTALLSRTWHGADKSRFYAWLGAYTPLFVKVKGNGQFDSLVWSDKKVKALKASGREIFDIDGASVDPWWSFERADSGKAKLPEMQKIADQACYMLARLAHESGSVSATVDDFRALVSKPDFGAFITKYMTESDTFDKWAEKYEAQKGA